MPKKSKSNVRHVPEAIAATMRPTSMVLLSIAAVFGGMITFNAFLGQNLGSSGTVPTSGKQGKPAFEATDKTSRTVTLKYDELIEDVQRELLATGHFQGLVDGVDGPKTQIAIETYQQQNGLVVTGVASPQLLEHIRFMQKVAQASEFTGSINASDTVRLPDPEARLLAPKRHLLKIVVEEPELEVKKTPLKAPAKPLLKKQPKLSDKKPIKPTGKPVEKAAEKPLPKAKLKPVLKSDPKAKGLAAVVQPKETATLKLQQRLAKLGFDPGTRSGEMDETTRAAILGFELKHGLNMEGKVSKKLLLAMKAAEAQRQAALKN